MKKIHPSIMALTISLTILSQSSLAWVSKSDVDTINDFSELPTTKPPLYITSSNGEKVENYDYMTSGWNEFTIDGAYATDKVKDGVHGKEISMNVYNNGYAAGALIVYDKNGKMVDTHILGGDAPATSIVSFTFGSIYNSLKQTGAWIGEYELNDFRATDAGKNEIKGLFVPEGGRVEISKTSTPALIVNAVNTAFQLFGMSTKSDKLDNIVTGLGGESILAKYFMHMNYWFALNATQDFIKLFALGDVGQISKDALNKMFGEFLAETASYFISEYGKDVAIKIIGKIVIEKKIQDIMKTQMEVYVFSAKTAASSLALAWVAAEAVAKFLDTAGKANDLATYKPEYDITIPLASCSSKPDASYCPPPKRTNETMLKLVGNATLYPTSTIGAAQTFNNFKPAEQNIFSNQKLTEKENFYLKTGTLTLTAPVDIVLNWGNRPADLDSHLTGPMSANSNERFHTWYGNKGNLDQAPHVMLYRDDVSHRDGGRNLPEQTRINYTLNQGRYDFYVHDFSNQDNLNSKALSQSGAVVSIHTRGDRNKPEGDNLGPKLASMNVPENRAGTVWHTFTINTTKNTIEPVEKVHPNTSVIK